MPLSIIFLFSFLLPLSPNLVLAADWSNEDLSEFKSLIQRMSTTPTRSAAYVVQKIKLRIIEDSLLAQGLTSENLQQARLDAAEAHEHEIQNAADDYMTPEDLELSHTIQKYAQLQEWERGKLVHEIIARPYLGNVDLLLTEIQNHAIAKVGFAGYNEQNQYKFMLQIMTALGDANDPKRSDIRRRMLNLIFISPRSNDLGTGDEEIQQIYNYALNPAADSDFAQTVEILQTQALSFENSRHVKNFIKGLLANPAYCNETIVKTLYEANRAYADFGYMFELIPLIILLPPQVRQPYLKGAFKFLNRFEDSGDLFDHLVFSEQPFLDLLSAEIQKDHTVGYIYGLMRHIFSRPEYLSRLDIFSTLKSSPSSYRVIEALNEAKLSNPELSKFPSTNVIVEELYKERYHPPISNVLAEFLLAQNQPYHLDKLKVLLSQTDSAAIIYRLFQSPLIHQSVGPELVKILFTQNARIPKDKLFTAMSESSTALVPELIELMLKNETITDQAKNNVLKQDHWRQHPQLLALMGSNPITLQGLMTAFAQGKTLQSLELCETILETNH